MSRNIIWKGQRSIKLVVASLVLVIIGFIVISHTSKKFKSEEYLAIQECIQGYAELEKQKINSKEMEKKRIFIHKPYLTRNDSLMIEIGGYTGADAERLFKNGIHPGTYISLEPVPKFYNILLNKFKDDKRFKVLNFGLGRQDRTMTIPIQTDATSLFRQNKVKGVNTTDISIREAKKFFDEVNVQTRRVDLLHINCEGCEFELLEDLISTGYIHYFDHLQFQFHMHLPFIENEESRYCQIMQLLKRTHTPMFQYRHTWQAWGKIKQ